MYIKTINEFIWDMENDAQRSVYDVLNSCGSSHSRAEQESWKEALPFLADLFSSLETEIREKCEIILEASFTIEDKRADAVLVGTYLGKTQIIVIENKRWSKLSEYHPQGGSSLWDPYHRQITDHPSRQAVHYKKTLEYTNKYIQDRQVTIDAMVLMQYGTVEEKKEEQGPFDRRYEKWHAEAPVFVGEERQKIISFIADRISGGEPGTAEKIYASEVYYSESYVELLGNLFQNNEKIKEILDENQAVLFDEIYQAVYEENGKKKVFIIDGAAGTGKTFVAIALLSYLYQQEKKSGVKARYVEKNRDPRKTLQREMNVPPQAMIYSLLNQEESYDCLICDESHRMRKEVYQGKDDRDFIERFLELSRISIFFYDERQRVHVQDFVTKERIKEAAYRRGISAEDVIEKKLVYQHRCHAADRFLNMVDCLLYHSGKVPDDTVCFGEEDSYQVALVDDPDDLFRVIWDRNSRRGTNHTSRVLAGKGRTLEEDWDWIQKNTDYYGCKTIAPLRRSKKKLYTWNFGNYGSDVTFASDEKSIGLVGCVDTSQGLDFEYIGVIIAPDLIYNPETERIEVRISGHQRSDQNTGGRKIRTYSYEEIEKIIKNTYRVLLSRGEKGCFIYCYDEALQQYLSRYIRTKDTRELDKVICEIPDTRIERRTGIIRYVEKFMKYAYIESRGKQYLVNEKTIQIMSDAGHVLIKGQKVSFTVWHGKNKDYANDIRRM